MKRFLCNPVTLNWNICFKGKPVLTSLTTLIAQGTRQDVLTMEVTPDIGESIVVSGFVGDLGTIALPAVAKDRKDGLDDFMGRSKKYLFHIPYACPTGTTFHPFLFRAVAAYLQEKQPKQGMDYALLVELQNHGLVSLDIIKSYIHDVAPN